MARKFWKSAGAVVSATALVGGLLALTATEASADSSLTANATDDATVSAALPNTVIGGTVLRLDAVKATERQSFLKFTVSGVPAGDSIASATLRLVNTDANTGNVLINSAASNNWTESTITWANKPLLGTFRDAATLAPGAGVATNFDVTSAVTGNGTVSFFVRTNNTTGSVLAFGARDNANTSFRPQLLIKTKSPATIKWGSSVEVRSAGETPRAALLREEQTMGKGAIRVYGQAPAFPTQYDPLDGRTIAYSFKGANPAQVVSGAIDAQFRQLLTDAKAYVTNPANAGAQFIWTYYHEPEDNIAAGAFTAADYRAAWGHLITISNEPAFVNVPQIKSALVLMKFTLEAGSQRNANDYYNAGVDIVGFDTYKWDPTTSVASMVDPVVAFAASKGKPWGIFETGVSVKHTTAQRQAALHDLAAYLATRSPQPVVVLYFNSDPGGPSEWQWPIDDEPGMADAWVSGQDGV